VPFLDLFSDKSDRYAYEMYEAREPKELWIIEGLKHDYPIKQRFEYRKRALRFFEKAFEQQSKPKKVNLTSRRSEPVFY
jgi:hypothetical protein